MRHLKVEKPGVLLARRGIFLVKWMFLPGLVVAFVLGVLAGILRQDWANTIGPWLFMFLGTVLLTAIGLFITAELHRRHSRAMLRVKEEV